MINLSPRMKMAADLVRKGKVCCDIGTDHAYLPAFLIQNEICPEALACDLRKGPLKNAEKTVETCGIKDRIKLRLSDGLDEIKPDEADDFVFCGMGGTLMTELISRTEWLKDEKYRLILQPQSHGEDIRQYLINNGFVIRGDDVCEDSGKLYCAFYAEYTGNNIPCSPGYIYIGNILSSGSLYAKEYVNNILDRLKIKAVSEKQYGSAEKAEEYYEAIKDIEGKLNEHNS